jgi:hypothetical protein
MTFSIFTGTDAPPTLEEMLSAVGEKRSLWQALADFVTETYRAEGTMRSYGRKYGWRLSFAKGSKKFLALYPRHDALTAQVILGRTQEAAAFGLPLGENARKVLENSKAYPEGRWLYIDVQTDRDVEDVKQLLLMRYRPPKR